MSGVFQSVGQALHVSFLMSVLPVTQPTSTQILIEGLKKRCGVWDDSATRAPSSIDFGGLTPLEVRGQCAMVRGTVQDHLPGPERDAIHARFGHQKTKADGVRGLVEYLGPLTGLSNADALLAVAWSIYQPSKRAQDRWSFSEIARQTGAPRHQLTRAAQVIRTMAQGLERRADERLTELFERTELVCSERDLIAA